MKYKLNKSLNKIKKILNAPNLQVEKNMLNCYLEQKEVQKWVGALNRENFDGVQGQRKKSEKKESYFYSDMWQHFLNKSAAFSKWI